MTSFSQERPRAVGEGYESSRPQLPYPWQVPHLLTVVAADLSFNSGPIQCQLLPGTDSAGRFLDGLGVCSKPALAPLPVLRYGYR